AKRMLTLALVALAVGALGAGCGGDETTSDSPGAAEQLASAISRYTGLSSGAADDIASPVRGSSNEALAAVARVVNQQPPLPDGVSFGTDLETIGAHAGFDGDAARGDLCDAILAVRVPQPSVELGSASGELEVHWSSGDPALQMGHAVHHA